MRGQLALAASPDVVYDDPRSRKLRAADSSALGRLMTVAYRGTVDDNGETPEWHDAEARATVTNHYGDMKWSASFVVPAPLGDDFIGCSIVTHYRGHPLLAFLLVDPEHQRRGLGSQLLARSAIALQEAGFSEWTLAVTAGNPAQRLYESRGFVVDESLRNRPG